MIYIDNGNGKWTQKTQSKIKDSEITFTLGQEFEETLADDRKSKVRYYYFTFGKRVKIQINVKCTCDNLLTQSVITLEGNTLTHKLNIEDSKYTSDIIRVFSDTEMKTTFNAGGKTGTRGFKKVKSKDFYVFLSNYHFHYALIVEWSWKLIKRNGYFLVI